jgi:uncharacterized protein
MKYFFYCRDTPETAPLRTRLSEAHQAFMDDYVPHMVARGPTLTEDGLEATGSMHIVDLPDDDAARSFAFEEPNYKAGVYGDVMIRRWDDTLGRTMWEFDQGSEDGNRFLVIGHGKVETRAADAELAATHRDWIDTYRPHLIVCGSLLTDDGSRWVGTALTVELPSRAGVDAMLANDPFAAAGLYEQLEVHPWRFGGRLSVS